MAPIAPCGDRPVESYFSTSSWRVKQFWALVVADV